MTKLQPTYGNFNLRGQVVWMSRPNAYRSDTSDNGYEYRSIRFGIKTKEKNMVQVELFSTKFNKVKLQNKESKALDKEVDYGKHNGALPDGYKLFMPINLGLEQDGKGENIKKQIIPYDAIEYISKHLKDGDTVFMFGSPRFKTREYNGDKINEVVFEPRGIYKSNTDYEDENFDGEAIFDQEFVLTEAEFVKEDNQLAISAYVITDKKGNFIPHRFFIDIDKYKKLAMNVKKLKFGTKLKVKGLIHHTVEEQEVDSEPDDWGEEPSNNTITRVIKSLEITKVEKPEKEDIGYYNEEDFVEKDDQEEPKNNPFDDNNNDDGGDWGDDPSDPSIDDDPFK